MLAFGLTVRSQTEISQTDQNQNESQNTEVEPFTLESESKTSIPYPTTENSDVLNYPKKGQSVHNLSGSISVPIYVVDGKIVDTIESLNPADIDHINILKDSSATIMYGERAANGAVVITTKAGIDGLPNITDDFSREH
ncbi:MAG: hypothetical protein WBG48_12445, partial [Pricia sp.]